MTKLETRTKSKVANRLYDSPARNEVIAVLREHKRMTSQEIADLLGRKACTVNQTIMRTRAAKPGGRKWFRIAAWGRNVDSNMGHIAMIWEISELADKRRPPPAGPKVIQARYYQKRKAVLNLRHKARSGQPINHWLVALAPGARL
jgi:hypothetical protein